MALSIRKLQVDGPDAYVETGLQVVDLIDGPTAWSAVWVGCNMWQNSSQKGGLETHIQWPHVLELIIPAAW